MRQAEAKNTILTASRAKALVLIIATVFLSYSCSWFAQPTVKESPKPEITEAVTPEPSPTRTGLDYSKFSHSNPAHDTLPCLICHTRNDEATRIGFPGKDGHLPCAGCHAVEFEDQSSTMCTICHTDAKAGTMKPPPKLQSFNAKFDHGRHLNQANCATCHTPSRRGVALSIPTGASAHATCFQCHSSEAEFDGKSIASCSTCHEQGRPPAPASDWAQAFKFKFSHASHRTGNMNCTTCHTVLAGTARGRQVTSPRAAMHFAPARQQSCATCHNNKRAFGEDFANCKRCHESSTFSF